MEKFQRLKMFENVKENTLLNQCLNFVHTFRLEAQNHNWILGDES